MEITINDILQLFKRNEAKFMHDMAELRASFKKTDARINKTDSEINKLLQSIKETRVEVGGIGKSNGEMAEEFFYAGLSDAMKIGDIEFQYIHRNMKTIFGKIEDEYDLVLQNSNTVVIVEVKYRLKEKHIEHLYNKKLKNFRKLYPLYNQYKMFGAVAGLSMEEEVTKLAKEHGFFVLGQAGKNMRLINSNVKAYSNGKNKFY